MTGILLLLCPVQRFLELPVVNMYCSAVRFLPYGSSASASCRYVPVPAQRHKLLYSKKTSILRRSVFLSAPWVNSNFIFCFTVYPPMRNFRVS